MNVTPLLIPSYRIPLPSTSRGGGYYVFDDFREAYAWLRHNTHPDAKVGGRRQGG